MKKEVDETDLALLNQLKKIYYELATEQDKIWKEAQEIFSPEEFLKEADFTQLKFEELKINLIKKYNITDSEYSKIMYEGANERWPFKSSF